MWRVISLNRGGTGYFAAFQPFLFFVSVIIEFLTLKFGVFHFLAMQHKSLHFRGVFFRCVISGGKTREFSPSSRKVREDLPSLRVNTSFSYRKGFNEKFVHEAPPKFFFGCIYIISSFYFIRFRFFRWGKTSSAFRKPAVSNAFFPRGFPHPSTSFRTWETEARTC